MAFIQAYYETSEIFEVVNTKDEPDITKEGFLQLGSKYHIPREWFMRKDVCFDIAIDQFAASLAISERSYLLKRIYETDKIKKINLTTMS